MSGRSEFILFNEIKGGLGCSKFESKTLYGFV